MALGVNPGPPIDTIAGVVADAVRRSLSDLVFIFSRIFKIAVFIFSRIFKAAVFIFSRVSITAAFIFSWTFKAMNV